MRIDQKKDVQESTTAAFLKTYGTVHACYRISFFFFKATVRFTMPASYNTMRLAYVLNTEIAPATDATPLNTVCHMVVKIRYYLL